MVSLHIAAVMFALAGQGDTVLLDFGAPWCAPCRSMEGPVAELERAGYPIRRVNVDRENALARQFKVESIPCFVLVIDGREAGRVTGAVPRSDLLALFSKNRIPPGSPPQQIARAQSPDASRRAGAPRNAPPPSPPRVDLGAAVSAAQLTQEPAPPAASPAAIVPVSGPIHSYAASVTMPNAALGGNSVSGASGEHASLVAASVRLTIEDPTGRSYGTGTIIDARQGEALIVTCGHVFRDSQGKGQILVDSCDPRGPQQMQGEIVTFDLKRDIALVSFRPTAAVTVAPVAPRGQRIAKGDSVVSVGCDHGASATAIASRITNINKFLGSPNLQVAGMPVQGRSGGGLFNADGYLIGVCNAADPTDHEGLYAALSAVQDQLDQFGLASIYQSPVARGQTVPVAQGPAAAPQMPAHMPEPNVQPASRGDGGQWMPRGDAQANNGATGGIDRATLAQLEAQAGSAEVICIVRSLDDLSASSEVIKLDRASSAFLRQLAADRQAQSDRHLTSFDVRNSAPPTTQALPRPMR